MTQQALDLIERTPRIAALLDQRLQLMRLCACIVWSDKQVWKKVLGVLREDADFEEVFLDSTVVRAHQHAAGAAKKKARR